MFIQVVKAVRAFSRLHGVLGAGNLIGRTLSKRQYTLAWFIFLQLVVKINVQSRVLEIIRPDHLQYHVIGRWTYGIPWTSRASSLGRWEKVCGWFELSCFVHARRLSLIKIDLFSQYLHVSSKRRFKTCACESSRCTDAWKLELYSDPSRVERELLVQFLRILVGNLVTALFSIDRRSNSFRPNLSYVAWSLLLYVYECLWHVMGDKGRNIAMLVVESLTISHTLR